MKVPFQFISVNGSKNASLQTDAELRDIKEILSGRIQPFDETAAHVLNLVAALKENKPKVVHFSGHGNNFGELMFLDKDDKPYPADKAAIQEIFRLHRGSVRLVVLSACCSAAQGRTSRKPRRHGHWFSPAGRRRYRQPLRIRSVSAPARRGGRRGRSGSRA